MTEAAKNLTARASYLVAYYPATSLHETHDFTRVEVLHKIALTDLLALHDAIQFFTRRRKGRQPMVIYAFVDDPTDTLMEATSAENVDAVCDRLVDAAAWNVFVANVALAVEAL